MEINEAMRGNTLEPIILVNYFYHEQIKKPARKGDDSRA